MDRNVAAAAAGPPFTVVVPCFNEEGAVRATLEAIEASVGHTGAEILVVDDGSTDGTVAELEAVVQEGRVSGLRVLHHDHNRGYGAAVKTGVRRASSDLLVIIDADGTYPADAIPSLLRLSNEADMVVAARTGAGDAQPLLRRLPKRVLRAWCSWLVREDVPDMNSGLRVFRRPDLERFARILPDGFSLTTTLTVAMMRTGLVVRFAPIASARRVGRSKIRPVADTVGIMQLILRTGMYFAPLRVLLPLVGVLGAAFLASLGYDVLVLRDLTEKTMLLLLFCLNTALFALLADMIDKRS